MTEELIHYTAEGFTYDPERIYDLDSDRHGYLKPVGLWVSVKGADDWESWCRAEGYGLDELAVAHRVRLVEGANILRITSGEGIDEFHRLYSTPGGDDSYYQGFSEEYRRRQYSMDWDKVAADYQGLIIAPYQWSHRLRGPHWYYGFDCASGCIWDLKAVKEVQRL